MRCNSLKWFVIAGCLLFSASICFGSGNEEQKAPAAAVSADSFEFPSAIEGSSVEHNFSIRNTGTAPLKIESVKTG